MTAGLRNIAATVGAVLRALERGGWRAAALRRVRAAAAVLIAAVLLGIGCQAPAEQPASEPGVAGVPEGRSAPPPSLPPSSSPALSTSPTFDIEGAASRFQTASRQAGNGWTFLAEGPVLAPGTQGEWDDFTVASPSVLQEDTGGATRYRMWYRGCHMDERDRSCAIGHAVSVDGVRWTKTPRPVFEPSDEYERRRLVGVAVARSEAGYFLWYSVAPDLFGGRKVSTLHLATSDDGVRWQGAGEVLEAREQLPYAIEPAVVVDAGVFHLWFVDSLRRFGRDDFAEHAGAPFLQHFTSTDGRKWEERSSFPLRSVHVGRVRVTVAPRRDSVFHATWFGDLDDQWGQLWSPDGDAWVTTAAGAIRVDRAALWIGDAGRDVTGATSVPSGDGVLAWFVTSRQGGREEIRVGYRKGSS